MKITSISICALKDTTFKKWYWSIGLNVKDNWAFYTESKDVRWYFTTKKEALSVATEFVKKNFKKVEIYYPK